MLTPTAAEPPLVLKLPPAIVLFVCATKAVAVFSASLDGRPMLLGLPQLLLC